MERRIHLMLLLFVATLLWLPATATAKANVSVNIKAEKEVVVTENGKEVRKIVEAKEILPGEVVTYTLTFLNSGDETAKNVELRNQIPPETIYVFGSATEAQGELTFSIDKGKNFKKPSMLTYEMTLPNGAKEKRVATPEQYTHIRWIVPSLAPAATGTVNFKVKVK